MHLSVSRLDWPCGPPVSGDPVLWGSIAFVLNYIPIMGPIAGIGLFLFAGLLKNRRRILGAVARRLVFSDPSRRRRSRDTDAACAPIYVEPGSSRHFTDLLVLDVGRGRRNSGCPYAGHRQDHLRRRETAKCDRPCSSRVD